MSIGRKIGEFRGKVIGQRMLPSDGLPKFETTAEGTGKILDIPARTMATYSAAMQPDGSLYGETVGPSPTFTEEGDMGAYRGSGVGRFTGKGWAVSFRGCLFYQGATGKLAPLNGLAIAFEWDVDEHGYGVLGLWEWK
jgi:hypothetical protein